MSDVGWLDRAEYPFTAHTLEVTGGTMHYLDEGQGLPIVMVHGTPTWSFEFRNLIKHLASQYRCVVPDHIGFGLSDHPVPYTLRLPDHARNLQVLIDHLGLEDCTFLVHDFGGPIGLSCALKHPDRVRAVVLLNTWMWSLRSHPTQRRGLQFAASRLGQMLYTRFNFSARVVLKAAWGDRATLTKQLHNHYLKAFPTPASRLSTASFAIESLASSDWFEELWNQRERLKHKPALLIWGERDPAFGEMLARWRSIFEQAHVIAYPDVGHWPHEERPSDVVLQVTRFLSEVYGKHGT